MNLFFFSHLLGEFIPRLQCIIYHLDHFIKRKKKVTINCVSSPRDELISADRDDGNLMNFKMGQFIDAYYTLMNASEYLNKAMRWQVRM